MPRTVCAPGMRRCAGVSGIGHPGGWRDAVVADVYQNFRCKVAM